MLLYTQKQALYKNSNYVSNKNTKMIAVWV